MDTAQDLEINRAFDDLDRNRDKKPCKSFEKVSSWLFWMCYNCHWDEEAHAVEDEDEI